MNIEEAYDHIKQKRLADNFGEPFLCEMKSSHFDFYFDTAR